MHNYYSIDKRLCNRNCLPMKHNLKFYKISIFIDIFISIISLGVFFLYNLNIFSDKKGVKRFHLIASYIILAAFPYLID